jgi:hypothetical protein
VIDYAKKRPIEGMGRPFRAKKICDLSKTQRVALGWYGAAPLGLQAKQYRFL